MARVLPATTYRPFRDEHPAFAVLEIRPVFGGVPGPAGRALICELEDGDALELEADTPDAAAGDLVAAVVPDDQHALRKALAKAVEGRDADRESALGELRLRLYRISSVELTRQLRRTLEDVPLRTLMRPVEGSPVAVFPLSDPALQFEPIHRGIRALDTFQARTFLPIVSEYAQVYELEASLLTRAGLDSAREQLAALSGGGFHAVLLVLPDGQGKLLRFRRTMSLSSVPAVPRNPTLRSLDLALVEALVFKTVLGIQEPHRADHRNVQTVDSLESLVEAVNAGNLQAGFALNPPPLWELRAVIEAAQKLPPRTVRITPLVPPGLFALTHG